MKSASNGWSASWNIVSDFLGARYEIAVGIVVLVGVYFLAAWQRWYPSGADGKVRAPFDLNFALVPTTVLTGIPTNKSSAAYLGLCILTILVGNVVSIVLHL